MQKKIYWFIHNHYWKFRYPIPSVDISKLVPTKVGKLVIDYAPGADGQLPLDQLLYLLAILKYEEPQAFLEIGTYLGNTSKHVALNSPTTIVHTIDLPESKKTVLQSDDQHLMTNRSGHDFIGLGLNIVQHFEDTATFDFAKLANPVPSLFFIDGAHTYEYVKNDTEKILAIATRDSVVLWHDCNPSHLGVMKYLFELRRKGRNIVKINGTPLAYLKIQE